MTAIAEDLPSAIQRAYAGVSKLQFEGMHYRKDIGAKALRRVPKIAGAQTSARPQGRASGFAQIAPVQKGFIPFQRQWRREEMPEKPLVGIVMGSDTDLPVMTDAAADLEEVPNPL